MVQPFKALSMAALIALGLAACSDAGSGEAAARGAGDTIAAGGDMTPAAMIDQANGGNASAADRAKVEADARTFIDRLFNGYASGDPINAFEEPREIFEPQLAAAIEGAMDEFERTEEMPDLAGADPICGCQDWGEFSHTINALTIEGDRAAAQLTVRNFGEQAARTIELIKTPGGWRVYDLDGTFRQLAL